MKKSRLIPLAAVLFVAVIVLCTLLFWPTPSKTITVTIAAPPGTKITGHYRLDDVTTEIDTEAPTSFEVRGRTFYCSVFKENQPGFFTVTITDQDGQNTSVTTDRGQVIDCGYESGGKLMQPMQIWARMPSTIAKVSAKLDAQPAVSASRPQTRLQTYLDVRRINEATWAEMAMFFGPPPEDVLCSYELKFQALARQLLAASDSDATPETYKDVLRSFLKRTKRPFDTEEAEFVASETSELACLVNVKISGELNRWLYGALMEGFFNTLAKIVPRPKLEVEDIQVCSTCQTYIQTSAKTDKSDIPAHWSIVRCAGCAEFAFLRIPAGVKSIDLNSNKWVEALNTDEYTEETALRRFEQIKHFRK